MLETLFLQIVNMSVIASISIAGILVIRLLLKKAPKCFSYLLWIVVLFRLLCPFTFESSVSVIPPTGEITSDLYNSILPDIVFQTPGDIETNRKMEALDPEHPVYVEHSLSPAVWISSVWFLGVCAMFAFNSFTLVKLKKKIVGAVRLEDNIYLVDHINSPFVLGLFSPKIYLPSTISENLQTYIIQHEQFHIRRKDHLIKFLAFIALSFHWFNPLVWLAFLLSSEDMEMSCDEAVLRKTDSDIRADYASTLLSITTGRKMIAYGSLAFNRGNTKGRIKNIMNYKKTALWVSGGIIAIVVAICICFSLNPKPDMDNPPKDNFGLETQESTIPLSNTHNLSQNGKVSTTSAEVSDFEFITNSEQIKIEVSNATDDVLIELYSVDDKREYIQRFTLSDSKTSDTFTNLTSSKTYCITATGDDNANIEISD